MSKPKINDAGPLGPFTNVSVPRRNTWSGVMSLNESPLNVRLLAAALPPLSSPPHVIVAVPTPERRAVPALSRGTGSCEPGRRKAPESAGAPNEPVIVPE